VVSWGWKAEKPGLSRFIDQQEWQGTRDIAAYLSVPNAISFQQRHDWPQVRHDCHLLAHAARKAIIRLTCQEPISPDSAAWYGQMISLPLPPCDTDVLKRRLYEEFQIEVPVFRWKERPFVRVSIQGYNSRQDIDRLLSALAELLPDTAS
jgi:isopenicillin-N epimerase